MLGSLVGLLFGGSSAGLVLGSSSGLVLLDSSRLVLVLVLLGNTLQVVLGGRSRVVVASWHLLNLLASPSPSPSPEHSGLLSTLIPAVAARRLVFLHLIPMPPYAILALTMDLAPVDHVQGVVLLGCTYRT